jgi:hypothetical protein
VETYLKLAKHLPDTNTKHACPGLPNTNLQAIAKLWSIPPQPLHTKVQYQSFKVTLQLLEGVNSNGC